MKLSAYKPCQSLTDLFNNDKNRYITKGIHLLSAALQAFVFFYFGPELMNTFWRYIIPLGEWKNVFLILNICFPLMCHFGNNLVYTIIYKLNHPFFEQYKVTNQPWPWQKKKEEWIPFRNRLIKYLILNLIIGNSLVVLSDYFQGVDHYNYSVDTLPNKFDYLWQIVFFMISEDFFFYFSHRFFHWKPVYRFHKIHHEHFNSFSFTPAFTHPVDYVLGSVLPFVSGFKILGARCHFSVYTFWTFWRVLETCDGHCGYEFPWAMYRLLPFSGSSDYHNFHHSKNVGNFSSFFTYLDSLLGTNKEYFKYKQSQSNSLEKKNELKTDSDIKKVS